MDSLIPNRLLFRFEFRLRHRPDPPPISGALAGWTDAELLPTLGLIDGEPAFAPLWCCWNDDGLYLATRVSGKSQPLQCDPAHFWQGDNLRLMVDNRDTRTIKRASRFCQQFYFLPCGGPGGAAVAGSAAVSRANEDAPAVEPGRIRVAAHRQPDGYSLEAHVPADCLSGFDPEQHRRIGFYTILEDLELGRQSLTIGDDLPWHVDPSLWATAVLDR